MIAYDTPLSLVEQLRSRISQFVNENSREWNNSAVWIDKMEFQNAIHLIIAIERGYLCFSSVIVDAERPLVVQIAVTGKTGVDDGRVAMSL